MYALHFLLPPPSPPSYFSPFSFPSSALSLSFGGIYFALQSNWLLFKRSPKIAQPHWFSAERAWRVPQPSPGWSCWSGSPLRTLGSCSGTLPPPDTCSGAHGTPTGAGALLPATRSGRGRVGASGSPVRAPQDGRARGRALPTEPAWEAVKGPATGVHGERRVLALPPGPDEGQFLQGTWGHQPSDGLLRSDSHACVSQPGSAGGAGAASGTLVAAGPGPLGEPFLPFPAASAHVQGPGDTEEPPAGTTRTHGHGSLAAGFWARGGGGSQGETWEGLGRPNPQTSRPHPGA